MLLQLENKRAHDPDPTIQDSRRHRGQPGKDVLIRKNWNLRAKKKHGKTEKVKNVLYDKSCLNGRIAWWEEIQFLVESHVCAYRISSFPDYLFRDACTAKALEDRGSISHWSER